MLVISVKEARKILGKDISDRMTDAQIEETIILMSGIAREFIKRARTDPEWIKEIRETANSKVETKSKQRYNGPRSIRQSKNDKTERFNR